MWCGSIIRKRGRRYQYLGRGIVPDERSFSVGWKGGGDKAPRRRGLKGRTSHPRSNLIAFLSTCLPLAQQKNAIYPGQPGHGCAVWRRGCVGKWDDGYDGGGVANAASRHYRVKWLFFSETRSLSRGLENRNLLLIRPQAAELSGRTWVVVPAECEEHARSTMSSLSRWQLPPSQCDGCCATSRRGRRRRAGWGRTSKTNFGRATGKLARHARSRNRDGRLQRSDSFQVASQN